MTEQPILEQREAITLRLVDFIDALVKHPQYKSGPLPNPTLFFIWDFTMQSKYMLSEYDSILAGRAVQHPHEFRDGGAGSGPEAALKVFREVCCRSLMLELLVNHTTNTMIMLTGTTGPAVDFGSEIKDAVKALVNVCPAEHTRDGPMG